MFDMFDEICAETLNVPVDVYIEKIESISQKRADVIINALLSCDKEKILKACKIFKMLE